MLKFAALSLAALAASSAYAQAPEAATIATDSTTSNSAPVANSTTSQPGAATNASPAPAAGAATAEAASVPSATNAQVAAVVEAGFPKYDADKDGKLSQAEFKQWISDLKTQEMAATGKPADPTAVEQYASAALAAADRDKDGIVTKQDLTTFLGG